jgi:myosin-1
VCDLLDAKKPPGLFLILDDTCKSTHAESAGADDKFVQKAAEFHGTHPHFTAGGAGFTILHYAGPVVYDKRGFTAANKDALIYDLLAVLKGSRNKFLHALYPEPLDRESKPATLGHTMKTQAAALVTSLMACEPHYVRCLKPNDEKKASVFDDARLVHQVC